jgi:hypothetical protein
MTTTPKKMKKIKSIGPPGKALDREAQQRPGSFAPAVQTVPP